MPNRRRASMGPMTCVANRRWAGAQFWQNRIAEPKHAIDLICVSRKSTSCSLWVGKIRSLTVKHTCVVMHHGLFEWSSLADNNNDVSAVLRLRVFKHDGRYFDSILLFCGRNGMHKSCYSVIRSWSKVELEMAKQTLSIDLIFAGIFQLFKSRKYRRTSLRCWIKCKDWA